MKKKKVFMHTCCAPCSVYCIDLLRKEGIEPVIYWYNPNIHPYTEYRKRKETLVNYAERINVETIIDDDYGVIEFTNNVIKKSNIIDRCSKVCYEMRLEKTAKEAAKRGYEYFTTTLLVSPYQNTEKLIEIGKAKAKKYGIEFLVRDFKSGFNEGQKKAKELGLYIQNYCGCVYSEAERYNKFKIKKVNIGKMQRKDNVPYKDLEEKVVDLLKE